MPDLLAPEDFRSLTEPLKLDVKVGTAPVVTLELAVESVEPLPAHRLRTAPFSLTLRGPRTPVLPQATYALRHPCLGSIALFLVPIGQDASATRYEATFN